MNLSIIIPVYNVEQYLEACIRSVLKQTNLGDTEIILVDDCGTDSSMDIARKIVDECAGQCQIKIVSHTHNQGLSAARNTGVKHAKGDYVFFLDSDDELPDNTIDTFNNYLLKYGPADFFIGNYLIEGPFYGNLLNNSKTVYDCPEDILLAYIRYEWYVMACGKFINRTYFIEHYLWFPLRRLHEDEYFSFHLAYTASRMVVIQENVYIYKIREQSITTRKKRKNFIDVFWITEHILKVIGKDAVWSKNSKIQNYIVMILFNQSLSVTSSCLRNKEKRILLKWIHRESVLAPKNCLSMKSYVKSLMHKFPPANGMYLYKFINLLLKCKK